MTASEDRTARIYEMHRQACDAEHATHERIAELRRIANRVRLAACRANGCSGAISDCDGYYAEQCHDCVLFLATPAQRLVYDLATKQRAKLDQMHDRALRRAIRLRKSEAILTAPALAFVDRRMA